MRINLAWVPNSLTLGNLLLGFISIVYSSMGMRGDCQAFFVAGMLILGAALFDGLDGNVARALNVTSQLGGELDSLADCVAFGVAPGFLAYGAYLKGINLTMLGLTADMGVLVAAIFPLCAAYRLARFNVDHVPDSFSGLPSPVAGVIVALVPVCFTIPGMLQSGVPRTVFAVGFVITALLMVSTIRFTKPQASTMKNITGIKLVLLVVFIALLVKFFKKWTVFIIIGIYIISGLLSFIIQFIQDHKY